MTPLPHNQAITVIDLPEEGKYVKVDDVYIVYQDGEVDYYYRGRITLPPGTYKLICLGLQATEEEAREIVEVIQSWKSSQLYYNYAASGRDYRDVIDAAFDNPKESIASLITANGWKNPVFLRKEN